jgi:hypothetical protein
VRPAVVALANVCEQERALLGVELCFTSRGGADEASGVVVVVFRELARLPSPEASWCDAELEG